MENPAEKRGWQTDLSYFNILSISWPVTLSYLLLIAINITDLYFVGALGREAIAAVAIGGTAFWFLCQILDGLRQGATILISGFLSSDRENQVGLVLNLGLVIIGFISMIFFFFARPFSSFVHHLMTTDPEVVYLGEKYLPWLLRFSFANFLFYPIEGFFRGIGKTVLPMVIAGAMCISNVILDWAMVGGRLGFSPMGVKGAAIATGLSWVVGLVLGVFAIFASKEARGLLSASMGLGGILYQYTKVSLEVGLFAFSVQSAILIFAGIMGRAGTVNLAAHEISMKVFQICYFPSVSFMITASIFVSALVSAGKFNKVQLVTRRILIMCFTTVLILAVPAFLMSKFLAKTFSPTDLKVAKLASKGIKLVLVDALICAFYLVLRGVLSGAGMGTYAMLCSFLTSYGVFLSLTSVAVFVFNKGLLYGYLAFIAWTSTVLAMFLYKYFQVVKNPESLCVYIMREDVEPGGTEQSFVGMTGVEDITEVTDPTEDIKPDHFDCERLCQDGDQDQENN